MTHHWAGSLLENSLPTNSQPGKQWRARNAWIANDGLPGPNALQRAAPTAMGEDSCEVLEAQDLDLRHPGTHQEVLRQLREEALLPGAKSV